MSKTPAAIESGALGVTVRGLTIEHFASAPQAGALIAGPGWTVKANEVRWNKSFGLMLVKAAKTRVERNLVHHNGRLGLGQYSSAAVTIASNVIEHNTITGNVNGISIQSRTRGDGPGGRYLLRNVQVTGNLVAMKGGTQSTGMVQNAGAEVPAGALTFTGNRYLLDRLAAQRFAMFGTKLTADGWRPAGLDTASSFKAS
jgi:hypothetical protein